MEIVRRNFTVQPQYEFAGKRIDLVVEGGGARLAVECDGDKWHGADQYEADMQRQRQLERCGWEFFRVREAVFYANKEVALEKLWQALEERRIFPGVAGDTPKPGYEQNQEGEDDCGESVAAAKTVTTIIDPPAPSESLRVWKDHLKELESLTPRERDMFVEEAIKHARDVIRQRLEQQQRQKFKM